MDFKSKKYVVKDIYESIVKSFSDENMNILIISENILKARYGGVKNDKIKNYNREKAIRLISGMVKNKNVQVAINLLVMEKCNEICNDVKSFENIDDIKIFMDKIEDTDKLALCILLWNDKNEEFNKFADVIYEEDILGKEDMLRDDYKGEKFKKSKEDVEVSDKKDENVNCKVLGSRTKELMNKSVFELIEIIVDAECKINSFAKVLMEKDNIINSLKSKSDKKDIGKDIKGIGHDIKSLNEVFKSSDGKIEKVISELDKKNKDICNKLSKQSAIIEKVQKKVGKNDTTDIINGIQSFIKNSLKNERNLIVEEIKGLIETKDLKVDIIKVDKKEEIIIKKENIKENNESSNIKNNESEVFDLDVTKLFE